MSARPRIGAILPQFEIGPSRDAIRRYGTTVEGLGYRHIAAFDHVVGADPALHDGWNGVYDVDSQFHEPMVAFGFLAAITSLEFVTSVIISPQRQTALLAKQATEVDLLSGGRFRLGIGAGWNELEYEAQAESFAGRGSRLARQVAALRALWTNRSVTMSVGAESFRGVGIAPHPIQRPIPIWIGGAAPPALRRIGELADGWFPLMKPGSDLDDARDRIAEAAIRIGRDPATIGMEGRVSWHGGLHEVVDQVGAWTSAGATHVAINTLRAGLADVDAHLEVLGAIAQALGIEGREASPDV